MEGNMELKEYFESTNGTGVLSTADSEGKVDAAVYARPHILDDGSAAFIMLDRLTHHNLQSNPHAAYLFIEEGPGYRGLQTNSRGSALRLKRIRQKVPDSW
jgi:hypothetical protein